MQERRLNINDVIRLLITTFLIIILIFKEERVKVKNKRSMWRRREDDYTMEGWWRERTKKIQTRNLINVS